MLTKKMNKVNDIASLHRYKLLVQGSSVLVFGFGLLSLLLFFAPWKIRIPEAQQELYRGNWIWLLIGIVFIFCSAYFIVVIRTWFRHIVWVYKNTKPEIMKLFIEEESGSDSTAYYANLRDNNETSAENNIWKVAVYSPSWNTRSLMNKEVTADVYFDPTSKVPIVIKTAYGFLWKMAGKGSAKKVI